MVALSPLPLDRVAGLPYTSPSLRPSRHHEFALLFRERLPVDPALRGLSLRGVSGLALRLLPLRDRLLSDWLLEGPPYDRVPLSLLSFLRDRLFIRSLLCLLRRSLFRATEWEPRRCRDLVSRDRILDLFLVNDRGSFLPRLPLSERDRLRLCRLRLGLDECDWVLDSLLVDDLGFLLPRGT